MWELLQRLLHFQHATSYGLLIDILYLMLLVQLSFMPVQLKSLFKLGLIRKGILVFDEYLQMMGLSQSLLSIQTSNNLFSFKLGESLVLFVQLFLGAWSHEWSTSFLFKHY
ncbi:UNKNOWN [Stylonychia lemnae]|uniref:Uncharacterized protein n=1 Tax=Stylonychia lemnae TaxID=5949 RepID=A0A078AFG1_STYLE|nr:UNKNOWN [Stylonychia lemnae]|eukprot:CDW80576.1 UNKNOWN [Stylonychia lemnae]